MFYLSKIATLLLLPPGLFFLLGALGGLSFLFKKKTFGLFLLIIDLTLLYLLSTVAFSNLLLGPYERSFSQESSFDNKPEYIVVLGGGSVCRNIEGQKRTFLSGDGMVRLIGGMILQKKCDLPLVFTGGVVLKELGYPGESEGAKRVLQSLDFKAFKLEEKSRNTFENALYTKKMIESNSIYLVTSAYHMKRSLLVFSSFFNSIIPYPVDYKVEDTSLQFLDFLPSLKGLQNSYYYFHEQLGLLFYRLRYKV